MKTPCPLKRSTKNSEGFSKSFTNRVVGHHPHGLVDASGIKMATTPEKGRADDRGREELSVGDEFSISERVPRDLNGNDLAVPLVFELERPVRGTIRL